MAILNTLDNELKITVSFLTLQNVRVNKTEHVSVLK